ncbi:hypothetical protein DL89DRAFT_117748 [Linderina pennispora]|uniref:Secreted protein n=1 Tax=Linderina pennispora TaxID=61395 RepID=A0A1Y1VWG8_9FUNG|nr:uncharacterized protein DL89DRAFT_117748 [Linderina pennispora]ORX65336.1 hypothetical protein DL89DRAFT_117748 [Linderina pennispora]
MILQRRCLLCFVLSHGCGSRVIGPASMAWDSHSPYSKQQHIVCHARIDATGDPRLGRVCSAVARFAARYLMVALDRFLK